MKKRLERVQSPQLGRAISLWSYGHWGPPLVVFPTAAGFAHEWEAQGMVEALAPWLEAGKLKLYCPESNVAEAWTKKENDAAWRIQRHALYEKWVVETLVPHIREGKLRPLAVITAKRSPILPDVPTLGEAGMPQFSITSWAALYGPAKLPREIVLRLNKEFLAAAQRPEVQNVLERQAFIFVGSTPEKLGAFTKEQNDEYKAMMRATGIEPE